MEHLLGMTIHSELNHAKNHKQSETQLEVGRTEGIDRANGDDDNQKERKQACDERKRPHDVGVRHQGEEAASGGRLGRGTDIHQPNTAN